MDGALAEWEDDDEWCIVGYDGEVISSAASLHVKPAVHGGAAHQPASSGGGVAAAYGEDSDYDYKTFPLPGPETIVGCGHGGEATVVPSTPPHSAGAPTSSPSSSPSPSPSPSPPLSPRTAAPAPEEAPPARPDDLVAQAGKAEHDGEPAPEAVPARPDGLLGQAAGVAEHDGEPAAAKAAKGDGAVAARPAGSNRRGADDAWEEDAAEATDDDDDDGDDGFLYGAYYDLADHGRARRVKRSKGRRANPKKMGLVGRPRCAERTSRVAVVF
ncbi:hypothetical protein ACP4OV_015834 [Aristida adscensionis]